MKVLLDARVLNSDGIGRYTINLLYHLNLLLGSIDNSAIKIFPFVRDISVIKNINTGNVFVDKSQHYTINELTNLSKIVNSYKFDLLHCADYRVPLKKPTIPLIVSLHDVFRYKNKSLCYTDEVFYCKYSKLQHKQMQKISKLLSIKLGRDFYKEYQILGSYHAVYYSFLLEWAVKIADKILVPSHTTQKELLNNFYHIEDKIVVVTYGIDHNVTDADIKSRVKNFIDIKRPYFLYVGQYRKHKNVDAIIKLFSKLVRSKPECCLYLVGKDFEGNLELKNRINRSMLQENVFLLGYVTDQQLSVLYRKAIALIHLSQHEGFGFTPLEAITHKCPVLALDTPIAREFIKDCAYLIDLSKENEIIDLCKCFLTKKSRKIGCDDLISRFSWKITAEKTLGIYNELIN